MGTLKGRARFDFIADFSSKFTVRVLFATLGLPIGDEAAVREKMLTVQSDATTRAKGPEHIAAYGWMEDYAARGDRGAPRSSAERPDFGAFSGGHSWRPAR